MQINILKGVVLSLLLLNTSFAAEKVLKVGTAGDYKPLTWYDVKTKRFSGTDIQLVKAFAKANDYKIQWIKTTWPNLSKDLAQEKFQMAIGGISLTPAREKQFLTSQALETSGKMALIRCKDKKKYSNLSSIDQFFVKVVENRGGTNEAFALKNLHKATIVLVPNNHLPFVYLNRHWADVMFTDSIEAKYQQSLNHGLCAVTQYQYDPVSKIALFLKNETQLKNQFDHWLENNNHK
ncbi:transporter substrate-binding domain-containing protein [bacterium SCSIO 12844]|nr:transporter substrate-binding domain-containing protein [bacterium SCSIO 12844]